ncbi:MAG TPA: hypothetical protein VG962_05655 [Steroidobacteraceae bacterium]|nr:hypothetical protein [Steroidobacteraceae bacterium]
MTATSIKLPDDLKRRIDKLAGSINMTPHAFMLEALKKETEQMELRQRFAADSARSEKQAFSSGKAYTLDSAFDFLESRAAGKKVRRPRMHSWRASK